MNPDAPGALRSAEVRTPSRSSLRAAFGNILMLQKFLDFEELCSKQVRHGIHANITSEKVEILQRSFLACIDEFLDSLFEDR